jgi:hypothetical protein
MGEQAPPRFQESQSFRLRHLKYVLAAPPAALLFVTLRQVVWRHPWQHPALTNGELLFQTSLLILIYLRLLTVRLVTELRAGELSVSLRGLWRKRTISMDRVRKARVVQYDPVHDFGGYGMRSGKRGQAYIASGDRGVELELRDGRKILIGSQTPDQLAIAIADSLSGVSPSA